jgi:hypothetical protein
MPGKLFVKSLLVRNPTERLGRDLDYDAIKRQVRPYPHPNPNPNPSTNNRILSFSSGRIIAAQRTRSL